MAAAVGESSAPPPDSVNGKAVVVRVKRKAILSRVDAFWLEINERPLKRPLLDFEKLSLSESTRTVVAHSRGAKENGESNETRKGRKPLQSLRQRTNVGDSCVGSPDALDCSEGLMSKKFFVQHVDTVTSSDVSIDVLQSYMPYFAKDFESKTRGEDRRHAFKKENKQDQLLSKAREKQETLAKSARFEQVWRSRKGNQKETVHEKALHEVCDLYDVVRVDVEETTDKKDMSLEEQMILQQFLPLMREHIPSAALAVEADIRAYLSHQTSASDYVYDLYTVKDDMNIVEEDPSNPFPLVQVDNDDDFYDGPPESDYETDDSNAEDNPRNDYPEEETSEDEDEESLASDRLETEDEDCERASDESEPEEGSACDKSIEPEDLLCEDWSEDADHLYEDINDYDCSDGYDETDGCVNNYDQW